MQIPTPPAEDDQVRRQRDAERAAQEQAAARTAEATTIGAGGLVVKDGGSIRVESPGTIDLPGGSFSANTLTATSTVTAGGAIQGGSIISTGGASIAGGLTAGSVSAGSVSSPGSVSAGGDLTAGGALRAISVYNTTLTTSYRAVWSTSVDGQLGYVPSSERFKQDIEALAADPAVLLQLQVVAFRYIAAAAELGDDAAIEVGFIAEQVHALGIWWLVDYSEDGLPFGVRYERIGLASLLVSQWLAVQHAELADRVSALEARLEG